MLAIFTERASKWKSNGAKRVRVWLLRSLAVSLSAFLAASQASAQSASEESPPASKGPDSVVQSPEAAEVLRKAEVSYYYVQSQGLKEFQCKAQLVLKQPAADRAKLAAMSQISFSVVVDDQGNATITPFSVSGAALDHSLDELVSSEQRTLKGFLQPWDSLVFSGLFSPSDDLGLTASLEQPDGFHFTKTSGDATLEFVFTRDSLLTTLKKSSPSIVEQSWPKFTKTDRGLLLTGVDMYTSAQQRVSMQIHYQPVEGFQLPDRVELQVTDQTTLVSIELNFSAYQLTKR